MLPPYNDSKASADSFYDIKISKCNNLTIHSQDKVLWKRNKKKKTNKLKNTFPNSLKLSLISHILKLNYSNNLEEFLGN